MRWFCCLVFVACACEGKRGNGGVDSESHWLEPCADDSTCGALACVCGVCSRQCTDACDDFEGAVCVAIATCEPGQQICAPSGVRLDASPLVDGLVGDAGQRDGARLDGAQPDGAQLDGAQLDGAQLDGAQLDGAQRDEGPFDQGLDPDIADTAAPDVGPACTPESECCEDVDCPVVGARCALAGTGRQDQRCAAPSEDHVCLSPECAIDADCGRDQACLLPGALGFTVATCLPRACMGNADCGAEAGGECRGFFTPCYERGYACVYPSDDCRVDGDCPQRGEPRVCVPAAGGGTECLVVE